MTAATQRPEMTIEEFLTLPEEEGVERSLFNGQLIEWRDSEISKRNRHHSLAEARTVRILGKWLDDQPLPHPEVVSGEAGSLFHGNPINFGAGIDVAILTLEQSQLQKNAGNDYEGPPLLAVEILSPSDTVERISDRIAKFLENGLPVLWIMNPYMKIITVHRKLKPSQAFTETDILRGDPELPGFAVPVTEFFW